MASALPPPEEPAASVPPEPPRMASRAEWLAALRWGLDSAIARDARSLLLVDPDFSAWPLDDPAWHEALAGWLRRPQRRLRLLAAGYEELPRRAPRFARWRAHWLHAIEALQAPEEMAPALPTLLLDDGPISVQLFDRALFRGRAEHDARGARRWRDELDAVLQRSAPAWPSNVLGL